MNFNLIINKEKPAELETKGELKCEWCQKDVNNHEYCWYYVERDLITCKKCGVLGQFKTFDGRECIVSNVIVKTNKTKEKQKEAFQI